MTASKAWALIHSERGRLADLLGGLSNEGWQANTLSSDWTVQETVAHLTAGANTTLIPWVLSMLRAGFKSEKHNQRQLARYLGSSPEETLGMFRHAIPNTKAPTKDYAAWLGEVIVHGQDIARPLGVTLSPDPMAVEEVARFYAEKDFAVNSKSLVSGLNLEASDSDFRHGSGPLVRGQVLDLVMVMAGRPAFVAKLEGDGVAEINRRLTQPG